jgi:NAD+ synthase
MGMATHLSIGLGQINPVVGDVSGNVERIRAIRADTEGVDLVIVGELAVCGYPPDDLVLKRSFQNEVIEAVHALADDTADGPALLVGTPWRDDGGLYNAAVLLDEGRIAAVRLKHELPNYGVFDEKRLFKAGPLPLPVTFRGVRLGIMVCEDMWLPDVARHLGDAGSDIIIVLNGSPFEADKIVTRQRIAATRSRDSRVPLVYVNLIGGQDELVFDGGSFVTTPAGDVVCQAPAWTTGVTVTEWQHNDSSGWTCESGPLAPKAVGMEAIYRAMVCGLSDYVSKNRFPGVVIGLSGGIDSALSACVAVDALGPEKVRCVMMPSPYTTDESLDDAAETARLLGVSLDEVPITGTMTAFSDSLGDVFAGLPQDVTEENIQARCRGIILMAISNKLGHMVLTTGNKSEMSVGYATLYGDMCGGFSVLKDVYKTTVFQLSRWRNGIRPAGLLGPEGMVIPERVISKPPTAELKHNQTDQDTLPPYDVLDGILTMLIEEEASVDDVVDRGFDADTARRVWRMIDRAEYKRRQAPPGVKITSRAFGRDRRYPIVNRFAGP